jgi:hypothetical protein
MSFYEQRRTNKELSISFQKKVFFSKSQVKADIYSPEALFTTLHFLRNLPMGQVTLSVCPWQAFLA